MVTFDQAQTSNDFHEGECVRRVGPRGGVVEMIRNWRRGGKTKVWKTRPGHFSIPVKHGLYASDHVTHEIAKNFHTADDCPLQKSV